MHASEMAEDFPVISVEDDAWAAVTQLAENRLPGLVVTDPAGKPLSILPTSQVVRILVPQYVQDDPSQPASPESNALVASQRTVWVSGVDCGWVPSRSPEVTVG